MAAGPLSLVTASRPLLIGTDESEGDGDGEGDGDLGAEAVPVVLGASSSPPISAAVSECRDFAVPRDAIAAAHNACNTYSSLHSERRLQASKRTERNH